MANKVWLPSKDSNLHYLVIEWFRELDSNQYWKIQNLLSYQLNDLGLMVYSFHQKFLSDYDNLDIRTSRQ